MKAQHNKDKSKPFKGFHGKISWRWYLEVLLRPSESCNYSRLWTLRRFLIWKSSGSSEHRVLQRNGDPLVHDQINKWDVNSRFLCFFVFIKFCLQQSMRRCRSATGMLQKSETQAVLGYIGWWDGLHKTPSGTREKCQRRCGAKSWITHHGGEANWSVVCF